MQRTRPFRWILLFLGLTIFSPRIRAELGSEAFFCCKQYDVLTPDGASGRHYAPDRSIDILHFALDVTPDFARQTVMGKATLTFKPIAKPLRELKLNAIRLSVREVTATEKIEGYQATDDHIVVTFAELLRPEKEVSLTIDYSAQPEQGLYFRTPEMGYKPEDMHLWTQGEPIEARHWYPSYDHPNEKFTSEITCRVPAGMTVLSNGRLMSEEKEDSSGLVKVRWVQDKPHVTYLISLLAGNFRRIEEKYRDIPLAFYTPVSQFAQASNSFRDTSDMMQFFEKEIGVPYPWAKYFQVCVDDFTAGGMENTSISTLTDRTLHTTATENLRSSQGLVAHELAHQWFGDLVTCKDWSHLWLNEGFATYYDALYEGHKNGRDAMLYQLYQSARSIANQPNDTNAMVRRTFKRPEDQFSYLAYPKGSWILHMLRSQLGVELYQRCVKTYLQRHQYDTVVTEDLNAVIEELSGRSYDRFFDQWVYHAHHPELDVTFSWDQKAKLAKLTVRQVQKLSPETLLFEFPLTIRFQWKDGVTNQSVTVSRLSEDFYFPLPESPKIVRLDPELTILAKTTFHPSKTMLGAQLEDQTDVIGRLLAVDELAGKKDQESIDKLQQTLRNDSFYGVRVAASKALRGVRSDEAFQALLGSLEQKDARARRQVLEDVSGFYKPSTLATLEKVLDAEKNPDILAVAIKALGAYHEPQVTEVLLRYLKSDSYRNVLAMAAVEGCKTQDDPQFIAPLHAVLKEKETSFTSGGYGEALQTLAFLARTAEDKSAVREFLVSKVDHPKRNVQLAVLSALGKLEDPKAIKVVETFVNGTRESTRRSTAEKTLNQLRDTLKPSVEVGQLRKEVLDLQKENRDLRQGLDDLKKKVEAAWPASKPKNNSTADDKGGKEDEAAKPR